MSDDSAAAPETRLAERMRALERLHRGLAHDLRGPLNGMTLNLGVLEATTSGVEGAGRWIAALKGDVERMRRGLERLLAQLAPLAVGSERFDLGKLLAEAGELVGAQCRQQQVEIELEPSTASRPVEGRRGELRLALLAVLAELLAGLGEGGRLRLEPTPEGFRLSARGDTPETAAAPSGAVDMAREIVAAHGGSLDLIRSETDVALEFCLANLLSKSEPGT